MHNADRLYEDRAAMLRDLRKSDVVCVQHMHLLADPARKLRRSDLLHALHHIEASGATVFEISTGRHTADRRMRDKMLIDATEALASGRAPNRNTTPGRPKAPLTARETAAIERHWKSAEHATDQDAARAIQAMGCKRLTASVIRKRVGNSGRPYRAKK